MLQIKCPMQAIAKIQKHLEREMRKREVEISDVRKRKEQVIEIELMLEDLAFVEKSFEYIFDGLNENQTI